MAELNSTFRLYSCRGPLHKNEKENIIQVRINLGSDSKLSSRTILTDIASLLKEGIEDKLNQKSLHSSKLFQLPVSQYTLGSIFIVSIVFLIVAMILSSSDAKPDFITGIKLISLSTLFISTLAFTTSFLGSKLYSCFLTPLIELKDLLKQIHLSSENNISVGNHSIGSIGRKEFATVLDNNQIESKLIKILRGIVQGRTKDGVKGLEVVFIFDELDKLTGRVTEKAEGNIDLIKESKLRKYQIDSLLGDLKNFITASKTTHIFIAGRDMYDAYLSERGSANSLYESLFNDHIYIPSLLTDRSDKEVYVLDSMIEAFVVSNLITKNQLENKLYDKKEKESFSINNYLQDLKLSTYARLLGSVDN